MMRAGHPARVVSSCTDSGPLLLCPPRLVMWCLFFPFLSLIPPLRQLTLGELAFFALCRCAAGRLLPSRPDTRYSCLAARQHGLESPTFATLGRKRGVRGDPVGGLLAPLACPGAPASAAGRLPPARPDTCYSCPRRQGDCHLRALTLATLARWLGARGPLRRLLLLHLPLYRQDRVYQNKAGPEWYLRDLTLATLAP